jgi:Ca2+-transporting ATPase
MSALRFGKPDHQAMGDEQELSVSKTHKWRWRRAFKAIYFTKALVSLSKKTRDKNAGPLLCSQLSYVAIDMQPVGEGSSRDRPVSFLNVDPKILSDMVREKNFESLNHFGGVKELVSVLETDVKDGINGSQADLIRRKNVFGANKYQKPPANSFLCFVIAALTDITIIVLLLNVISLLGSGIIQGGWKDGWYDGGIILVAVILVVAVSNCKKSRKIEKF